MGKFFRNFSQKLYLFFNFKLQHLISEPFSKRVRNLKSTKATPKIKDLEIQPSIQLSQSTSSPGVKRKNDKYPKLTPKLPKKLIGKSRNILILSFICKLIL